MNHSRTNPFSRPVLPRLKRVALRLGTIRRSQDDDSQRDCIIVGESPLPQSFRNPLPPILDLDHTTLRRRYALIAQELLPSLPRYPPLNLSNIKFTNEHPLAAGGSADILPATYGGRKVVLKSRRCYVLCDVTEVAEGFYNEVRVCSLLPRADTLLVGVCCAEEHPFGLVYEHADNLDLRQYLGNKPAVRGLSLLTTLAQRLSRMHNLGIAHCDLRTPNILIDKDGIPYLAGLGSARVLPHSPFWTERDSARTDQPHRCGSLESTEQEGFWGVTNATHPTQADDMRAFGFVAFEIFTGQPVFHEMTQVAAMYAISNGSRPPRPENPNIPNLVWQVIQSSWNPVASSRPQIEEVVGLLEAELTRVASSGI